MVVQHNLTAMNSNRMLGITSGQQAKVSEKLSSGYKINRAADDAAGLSISEKMRKQINGLSRASTNAQDGVSSVQTAEGALSEVHSMLQRMNELSVQAANGTNSVDDRDSIQAEISQLTTEINRVAETTKFNETYLLKGNGKPATHYPKGHDAGLKGQLVDGTTTAEFTIPELQEEDTMNIGGTEYTIGAAEDLEKNIITADVAYEKIKAELTAANNIGTTAQKASVSVTVANGQATFSITKGFANISQALSFALHVGSDADMTNKINVDIQSMSAANLGIEGMNISDDTGLAATYAIDAITDALAIVSEQRSSLGAIQNRLEHTIANLDNVVENTTDAESRIRDTDMAAEMMAYTKNNILIQASQAMLAQANQVPQGVLQLLQ